MAEIDSNEVAFHELQQKVRDARKALKEAENLNQEIYEKILAEKEYRDSLTGERILKATSAWTMSDDEFKAFLVQVQEGFLAKGINNPFDYHYPATFQKKVRAAESELFQAAMAILPKQFTDGLDGIHSFPDLWDQVMGVLIQLPEETLRIGGIEWEKREATANEN